MTTRRTLLASAAALVLSFATPASAQSSDPIPVIATFSILGDMVARIGGEHVSVATLVGPDGDAHVFQPTPADARAVSEAKVLFVNGLEFEGWINRLVDASGFKGPRVAATQGIEPIAFDNHDDYDAHGSDSKDAHEGHGHDDHAGHDHGAFDPHAWQDLGHAVTYAENIMIALARVDPDNAAAFYRNRVAYVAEIQALAAEIHSLMAVIPEDKRTVVTSHDAFGYFAKAYGLTFKAPQGLSTESDPSAADVARLIEQIREEGITAVFLETITDNRLLEQIARETGATIGGTLYSDALSGPDGPASTYLDMMRHNATTLATALGS